MFRLCCTALLVCLNLGLYTAVAQAPATPPRRPRTPPPTRDPHTAGYVKAKELLDSDVPPAKADGNFIIGPTHNPATEMTVHEGVPQGTIYNFTMESADSKIYPGIAREPGSFARPDPNNPGGLLIESHPAPYTRHVAVYVPKQYVPGTVAPFIVGADGPDPFLFTALDNLIAEHRVPVMIAISIGNGSGDAQGSERGLEYDTMSGRYAEFVEQEVLPLVEKPGDHGRQLRRLRRVEHGVVSHRTLPSGSHLLRHLCEPAMAGESGNPAWRMGVSRTPDPQQPA
jgi:iron(III)-enterobactin esterase